MRVLIIEDEAIAAGRLKNHLKAIGSEYEVVAILDSIEEAVKWFKQNQHPDIVFLDIQLSDGISFEIFNQVSTESLIIFTTAFDEYAIRAFELHCVDYLLKPVSQDKLELALMKVEKHQKIFSNRDFEQQLSGLLKSISQQGNSYRSRFLITRSDGYIPVMVDEIAYFYSEDENIFAVTHNGEKHKLVSTLEALEAELDPALFWRACRSSIVSAKSIIKAHNYFNYKIKLELRPRCPKEVIVSRNKVPEFKEWFSK